MSATLNNLFKNILCLFISVLLSFTELQFFEDAEIFSVVSLLILSVTVPTIYLYFLPKQDTVIIFIYNIVLVFILDVLGKNVDIKLFLMSLFCICLLLFQSVFTENSKRFKSKNVAYRKYSLVLITFLSVTVLLSFLIYEYILLPNMHDKSELSLSYANSTTEETIETNQNYFNNSPDKNKGGAGGGGSEKPKPEINILRLVKIIAIFALCLVVLYFLYRFARYKLWLRKTLRMPFNEQVCRFYCYIVNSLASCGFQRKSSNTPFEYLDASDTSEFPLLETEFKFLTNTFVKAFYSNREISKGDCERCLELFKSVSKSLIESMGMKDYLFHYLLKFKWKALQA